MTGTSKAVPPVSGDRSPDAVRSGRATILIIDDSKTSLAFVSKALRLAGHHPVPVDNPIAVPAVVMREKPHAYLVDLLMPSLSGEKVVEFLRDHHLIDTAPVILYSDQPQAELEAAARRCGANGAVRKSADPQELVRSIDAVLASTRRT
jgi:DNA-binding response OmpR family regulator